MATLDEAKRCTYCGITKPLTHYTRRHASKDGHAARCRPCLYAAHAIYRLRAHENPRIRDHSRLYTPWEDWEYQLVARYPDLEPRMIAPALKRSPQAVREARKKIARGQVNPQLEGK